MASFDPSVNITLQLNTGEDSDSEEVDRSARRLLAEIKELDVESAVLVKGGEIPAGAKTTELVTLGSLAIVTIPVIIPKLMELIHSWTMRAENRTVKIKAQVADRSIEVEYSPASMSCDDLKRLINTLTGALPPTAKS